MPAVRAFRFFSALFLLVLSAASAQNTDYAKELAAWRAGHATTLQKPDNWLSLIGLEWLQPGDTTVGSALGSKIQLPAGNPAQLFVLRREGDVVTLLPPPGGFPKDLLVAGSPATQQALHTDADTDRTNPRITIGTLNMYVIHRGDRFALRIKDAKSPAIQKFHGLSWYPFNPAYRVTAKWIPYVPQKSVMLATLIGTSYAQPVPGAAEFTLRGKNYRLEPILEDAKVAKLFFILKDTTSASTTYGACRFLYTGFPSNGLDKTGELILDFNKLENPPCAYTPYATCPLPPPGNRLKVALPVGEKRYHN